MADQVPLVHGAFVPSPRLCVEEGDSHEYEREEGRQSNYSFFVALFFFLYKINCCFTFALL